MRAVKKMGRGRRGKESADRETARRAEDSVLEGEGKEEKT